MIRETEIEGADVDDRRFFGVPHFVFGPGGFLVYLPIPGLNDKVASLICDFCGREERPPYNKGFSRVPWWTVKCDMMDGVGGLEGAYVLRALPVWPRYDESCLRFQWGSYRNAGH